MADNYVVKDGTQANLTKASKDIGGGVQADKTVLVDTSGAPIPFGTAGQRPVAEATTVIPPSDAPFPVTDAGSGLTSSWGVAGVPVNSADMSGADAAVTDAPTSAQKIVIDDILISVGSTAMSVTLKEETSGTILFGPWYCPANSGPIQITLRGKKKLAVANKKVMARTSAAGNVTVQLGYHSEA